MNSLDEKKRILSQYLECKEEFERQESLAKYWRDKAYSISAFSYEPTGVRSTYRLSPVDRMLETAEKCEELSRKAQRKCEEIESLIDSVENASFRRLLKYYYIDGLTLRLISYRMHLSYDRIRHMHLEALKKISFSDNDSTI